MSPEGVLFFSTRTKSFLLTPASTIWMQCLSDNMVTITLSYLKTPWKKRQMNTECWSKASGEYLHNAEQIA